jgi:hypothetical protein
MASHRIESVRATWSVYESNVQQYRSLSVTVQSFFLTVGSLVATSSRDGLSAVMVMGLVTSVGLFHLLYVWHLPLRARHKIVDYYKFQIERGLTDDQIAALDAMCSVDEYVNNPQKRLRVNTEVFGKPDLRVFRTTRMKFDIVVPCLYALVWMALISWTLHTHF